MLHSNPRRRARQIETLRTQFAQSDGLAFTEVLSADRIETALREEGATWREGGRKGVRNLFWPGFLMPLSMPRAKRFLTRS